MYTRNLMYFPANSVPILAVTLTALVVVPNLAPESIVLQLKGHWKDTVVILVLFPDQLFLPRRGKNSLMNSLFCFISCGCKNCDIKFVGMYYDIMQSVELLWDTVILFVFLRGSDHKGKILERKTSVSIRETLEQTHYHSNFPLPVSSSQTHPDCSQNFWQPSGDLVSVLHSLVS